MEDMPPGYRFYPTEEELVSFYLRNKLDGAEREDMNRIVPVLDIYDYNPWDLPQVSGVANLRDTEQWFFFIPRQESEARGGRPKRLTTSGYWKATGSPSHVYSSDNRIIGMKRTMVFYNGRAPSGKKTDWKMNEYKAIKHETSSSTTAPPVLSQEFSLCRVYKKSKCVRAFDRRPPPRKDYPRGSGSTTHREGSTSYPNNNNEDAQRASSSESLSSGEHGQPSHSSQIDIERNEPLLDWDHLDWFLGSDQP
ncbi:hypothetical protein L6164_033880 [Bauhinia variegata]|uniref:Uncharacterized protein n=1 Tax=Bauhinia variegata TaxID=167791 RepID=A0ACB9KTI0_BAUVA|nr:hypothetical protein L6164_033880 [Bauhinia variegata]